MRSGGFWSCELGIVNYNRYMMDDRVINRWYWVRVSGGFWLPAMYHPSASGGWTNGDTWEDFDGEVDAWREIVDVWHEDVNGLAGFAGFVWVVRESGEGPELAYYTRGGDGKVRFQDPCTAGDAEGLSIEYYDDVVRWADLREPVGFSIEEGRHEKQDEG